MRVLLLPAVALALIGAKEDPEPSAEASSPPTASIPVEPELPNSSQCADRIHHASSRPDSGQVVISPPIGLDRRPAKPKEFYAIWAVDRRENGCPVMVRMGNLNDIRPVPSSSPDDVRRIPAED